MSDWMDNLVRDDAGLRAILREAKTLVGTAVDLPVPVDVVEILRLPEYLSGHAREIRARPGGPRRSGSSSASATTPRLRRSPARASAW